MTPAAPANLNTVSFDSADLNAMVESLVNANGYAIVPDVLDAATCTALISEVDRVERELETPFGNNEF